MSTLLNYIYNEQEKLVKQLEVEENIDKITEIQSKLKTLENIKNEHLKGK